MKKLATGAAVAILTAALWPSSAVASGQVIVKYRKGATIRGLGVHSVGRVRGQGTRVVAVDGDPVAAAARIDAAPGVSWAEPDYRLRTLDAPNDPLLDQLGGLGLMHATSAWDALRLPAAWPATGGVPVGIVDTGVDSSHEDLIGKVSRCGHASGGTVIEDSCDDDNDHGTHVAGTIGALAGNGVGIAGVAFNSPLIVCKALDADGGGATSDIAGCISWAHARGARVISLSLGGPASHTLASAVRAAWAGGRSGGSVIVAAAGNDGDQETEYPAGYPEVVSVGAVDDGGRHAAFSNSNADVEVAAPGVDVLSTRRGGGYLRFSGTSMATPHAAGAAALLWDAHRRSAAATIRGRLDGLAADAGPPGRDPDYGFGILDLAGFPNR